jgi:hypothetical protein
VVNRYEVQVCKPITAATCNSNTNWKAAVGFAGVIGSPSGETFGVTGFGSPTVSIAPNTAYMFRVRALNPWGNSSYLTSAAQTTLPSQVTSLAGVTAADPINVGKSKVTLSWVNPNVGITPTVKVMLNGVVVANTVGNVGNIGAPTTVAGVTSVTISNLKPSLLHTFTVSTSNAATGTASASIDVTTATAALGNFVTLAPGSLTANSLTLNWLNSNGIAPAVKVALAGSATPLQIAPADLVVTTTGVAIANLTPNTSYDVSVTVGNQTQTTTQQTAAAPITALPVSGLSSTGVTLHWVNTNAGPLPTISGGGLINVISPTSATVTNLTPNTFYNFVVTVAGQVTQISVTTNSANVTNLAVSSVTNTSANVNWTNPTDGGNAVLTVSPNTVGIVITPNGTASGAVVTGLSPSTLYTFSVSVTGSNGLPSVTVVQTATTLAALQAPINLVATKTDLTTIRITWQDSSVGETGAYIRLIDTTANPRTTVVLDGGVGLSSPKVGGTITTVISNLALIPGHVYFINVNAMSAGTYSVSAAGAYVTDASITASATLLTVTNVTQDSASVSWINPVGGGNAVLTVSPSTVGVVITPNGTGNGAVVAGLNANTSYTFSVIVTATNLTPSIATTANVTTLAPVLLVPTNITPIMTGTTLQVTWTDNSLGETGAYLRLVDTTANPRTTVVLDGGAGLASPNVGGTITAVVNNLTLIPGHVYFMNVNPLFGGSFGPAGGAYVK